MPTTPNIDTARRLKDISTLSQMITATTNDPDHADVTTHLQDAVVKLGNVIGSDGGEQVRLVKSLVLLLQRLGTLPHPEAWLKRDTFDLRSYPLHFQASYSVQVTNADVY